MFATAFPNEAVKPESYKREVELAAPVSDWLRRTGAIAVTEEIDAGFGVADLLGCYGDEHSLASRVDHVSPLSNLLHLRLLEFCNLARSERELRDWAPAGWNGLKIRAIEPLLDLGYLLLEKTGYISRVQPADPFKALCAIELKLSNWKQGLAQATRYRLFAESTYLALPANKITCEIRREARRHNIGLLAVSDTVSVVEPTEPSTPIQMQRRRWASECALYRMNVPPRFPAGSPLRPILKSA